MFKKGDVLTHVNGTDVQRLKIVQVFPRSYPASTGCPVLVSRIMHP